MITTEAVRNYLNDWGFPSNNFLISQRDGRVVVVALNSSDSLRGAAHYLRFCPVISVDESPERIVVQSIA